MFLLDTDTIIYSLKGVSEVVENFRIHAAVPKALSVITYGELVYGAQNSARIHENLARIHKLREFFPVIDVTCAVMESFGLLKAQLKADGRVVDDFDLVIGATALTMGYTVVTNNERHFSGIPGVRCVNWTKQTVK